MTGKTPSPALVAALRDRLRFIDRNGPEFDQLRTLARVLNVKLPELADDRSPAGPHDADRAGR